MPTCNVSLTEHQLAMVDALVKEGRYRNASEVLGAALRLLEQRDAEDRAKLKLLREAAQVGIDAIAGGHFRDFETPEALDEFLAELSRTAIAGSTR